MSRGPVPDETAPGRPASGVARVLGWCLLVGLLAVQVVGLYSPTVPGPEGGSGVDKVGHVVAFALPAALAWVLGARWVVVLLVLHALVSEPLQGWVAPLRRPDPLDAVADLVGVALGVGAGRSIRGARRRRPGKMVRARSEEVWRW